MNILFMCVANSARSQLAEGLAKKIFGDRAWIESAGSEPKIVNAFATRVLAEVAIDISKNYSKSYEELPKEFVAKLDYMITLCADEVCPVMASRNAKRLHWPFQDPAGHSGSEAEQLERFRQTRDLIKAQIETFASSLSLI